MSKKLINSCSSIERMTQEMQSFLKCEIPGTTNPEAIAADFSGDSLLEVWQKLFKRYPTRLDEVLE